jgi:membrane protease YdiL (CAAX protease family)
MIGHLDWISAMGWYHLLIFGLLIPAAAIRSLRAVKKAPGKLPSRGTHFRTTVFLLIAFAALSLLTAKAQHVDLFVVDWRKLARAVPAGVAMYVVAVLAMRPRWRKTVERKSPIVRLFMPTNRRERAWWIAVSILAGISEEITWRGMQTTLLDAVLGNVVAAVLLCAILFGVAHAVQGWKSVPIVTLFALGFQGLVALTGSLYLAMAVHLAYDITAGLTYGRLGRELGYEPDVAPATT